MSEQQIAVSECGCSYKYHSPLPVYRLIAQYVSALKSGKCTQDWAEEYRYRISEICRNELPSGSGFDSGTTLDFERSMASTISSIPEKLVFDTSFHHMDVNGFYDGWTEHSVTVRPSLQFEITLQVSGRDRNEIKDYIYETFEYALTREILPCKHVGKDK